MPYFQSFFNAFKDDSFSKNKTIIIYDFDKASISKLKERIRTAVNNDAKTFESIEKSIQFKETYR